MMAAQDSYFYVQMPYARVNIMTPAGADAFFGTGGTASPFLSSNIEMGCNPTRQQLAEDLRKS